jgi:uncharacterized protein YggE
MKRLVLMFAAVSICILSSQLSRLFAAETSPTIIVQGPTMVAFFPPVTKAGLEKDTDTNETLADFQTYVARVREPLQKSGVEVHELYTHSFQVRVGKTVTTFRPSKKEEIGYYFIAPGKKPRIEYGVMTNVDLLDIAHEYFAMPAQ